MGAFFEPNTGRWGMDYEFLVNRVCLQEPVVPHTHDFVELVYTFRGKGIHYIDGKAYPVKSGELLLVNYHCKHEVIPIKDLEYTDLMLKPDYIDERLKGTDNAFSLLELNDFKEFSYRVKRDNCVVCFSGEERKTVESLITGMETEQKTMQAGSALMMRSFLNLLLTMVFRKMALPMSRPFAINEELLAHIRANCGEALRLEQLAANSFYTPSHFSRLFKSYTGMTLTQYVNECRLEKAMHLLTESDLSIEKVIENCGFANRTKFFRLFSQRTGTSPLKYRKNQK